MKKLLLALCSTILLLGGCKSNLSEEPASSPTLSSAKEKTQKLSKEELAEQLLFRALYDKYYKNRSQARSLGYDPLVTLNNDASALLSVNIHILEGNTFFISGNNPAKLKLYFQIGGNRLIYGRTGIEDASPFYIQALPPSMGFEYFIHQSHPKSPQYFLGANLNTYTKDITQIVEGKNILGRGWDILISTQGGLVLENTARFPSGNSYGTGRHVLTLEGGQNSFVYFRARNKNDLGQEFLFTPRTNFRVLGIRYFSNPDEYRGETFSKDTHKKIGQDIVIRKELNRATFELEQVGGRIQKVSELKITRTYTNTSHREEEVDMVFDSIVPLQSKFEEVPGLDINTHKDRSFTLPSIVDGSLKFLPNDIRSSRAKYQDQSIDKKLNGMLPLLISPRSEARVVYTYSVYQVKIPYFILLAPENDYSGKIIKVLGMWEGTIYTELDTDKHRFSKKSLDPPASNVDEDDEEIDFDLSNADINRIKRNEGGFRSASTTQATQRIRL